MRILAKVRAILERLTRPEPVCWRCGGGPEARLGFMLERADGKHEHWRCIPAYVRYLGGALALYIAGEHQVVVSIDEERAVRQQLRVPPAVFVGRECAPDN